MQIETERLILREMNEEDFDDLYCVLADSDIMQHYPYTFDEKRVRGWIEKNQERYQIFGFGLWAVCLKENRKMIGDCGLTLQPIGNTIKPEIGYHIQKIYQRKGYAKEAAIAVRDWAFTHKPIQTIYSYMKSSHRCRRRRSMDVNGLMNLWMRKKKKRQCSPSRKKHGLKSIK